MTRRIQFPGRVAKTIPKGPRMADRIFARLVCPVDLYRGASGWVRVEPAGAGVKGLEYLGRFDEGATWQDINEAIE